MAPYITLFSRKPTVSHRQAKHFELNFVLRKTFSKIVKPSKKNIGFTAGQLAKCPVLK